LEKEVVRKDGNENERLSNFTQRYKSSKGTEILFYSHSRIAMIP
jgi:hypothetical protein